MLRNVILAILFCVVNVSVTNAQQLNLRIDSPLDNASVIERPLIEGKASDPNATVWVIVHPMAVSDYWVQPKVTLRRDGTWRVQIYLGKPGSVDTGKRFEIMAISNPKTKLKEGDVLKEWPEAQGRSEVIEVIRK